MLEVKLGFAAEEAQEFKRASASELSQIEGAAARSAQLAEASQSQLADAARENDELARKLRLLQSQLDAQGLELQARARATAGSRRGCWCSRRLLGRRV